MRYSIITIVSILISCLAQAEANQKYGLIFDAIITEDLFRSNSDFEKEIDIYTKRSERSVTYGSNSLILWVEIKDAYSVLPKDVVEYDKKNDERIRKELIAMIEKEKGLSETDKEKAKLLVLPMQGMFKGKHPAIGSQARYTALFESEYITFTTSDHEYDVRIGIGSGIGDAVQLHELAGSISDQYDIKVSQPVDADNPINPPENSKNQLDD